MPADQDFDAASNLAQILAVETMWAEYVAYLELRGEGLRQPALKRVRSFADLAAKWPFEERWRFTQTVLNHLGPFFTMDIPLPHPLVERLLRPTLVEAAAHFPNNPWPPYWLGQEGVFDWQMIAPDVDRDQFSKEALRRDPNFQPALKDLVGLLMNDVGYAQHELPHGYLGDPTRSLRDLDETRSYLSHLADARRREELLLELGYAEQIALQYLAFLAQGSGTYQQWCDERGLPYGWGDL